MSLLVDRGTGLERLGRETYLIMAQQLNSALVATQADWDLLDLQLANTLGLPYEQAVLEMIPAANFHLGHKPSLIRSGVGMYPAVCVMAYNAETGGDNDNDFSHSVVVTLYIEVMVKAGPYGRDDFSGLGEDLCNKRIQRTVDAIHTVLMENRTLNGLVHEISTAPACGISNVFATTVDRDGDLSQGVYFWQGARLEYDIERQVLAS